MMSVEVKQTLERNYDVVMGTREIRQLTVNKLKNMANSESCNKSTEDKMAMKKSEDTGPNIDELMPSELIVKLNDRKKGSVPLYIIHPIEG